MTNIERKGVEKRGGAPHSHTALKESATPTAKPFPSGPRPRIPSPLWLVPTAHPAAVGALGHTPHPSVLAILPQVALVCRVGLFFGLAEWSSPLAIGDPRGPKRRPLAWHPFVPSCPKAPGMTPHPPGGGCRCFNQFSGREAMDRIGVAWYGVSPGSELLRVEGTPLGGIPHF